MPKWTKEQEEAIYKSGSNIIVSAGAGSGKTAVLTERVIKKIENGIHINELLILTFTKAAASEMKERIRESLKKNNFIEELKLIDSAYITTFDSYALSIVKKYHYVLNISNNINIVEATLISMEKNRIMDKVFEYFYNNEEPHFLELINDFCIRDDKTIKKYIITMANKLEMIPNVNLYLDDYIANKYSSDYIDERILEYENIVLKKIKELKSKLYDLSILVDGDYYTKVLDSLNGLLNCETLEDILLFHNLKLPTLPRGSEDDVKALKEEISVILKTIDSLSNYGNKEEIKTNLLKTKKYVQAIILIIKEYFIRIKTYKKQNEMYEFTDIALLAIEILQNNTNICNEVKESLKEILVDEYQDTNDLQETFINLIANNNVYMVGDVKQSIYRFRNANPYIFKDKYDRYTKGNDGYKIDLVKNFRSRDIVLNNINEIFDLVMDDLIGGAEYQESHRMVFGNTTYIEEGKTNQNYDLEVLEYEVDKESEFSKEEIEIFAIAKDIKEKVDNKYQVFDKSKKILKDVKYSDFVILMDRTTNFDLYKKIFEYLGIPLTLYKDETLNNSDDIYIIKNIIELIIKINTNTYDTQFKYDFISVARSFLFEYTDEQIFSYFANNNFNESELFQLFKNIDIETLTSSQLLELIITRTSFYEKIIKVGDIENRLIRIQKLLELSTNLSSYGYDIYDFSEYLNNLVLSGYEIKYSLGTGNGDSVKIMTIHKSKGLEYHICYFSGLYKAFNISDLKDTFMYSNKYGFITPYFEEGINYTIYKELLKESYMNEEISEKIRLFYVALTRAKEKMIMLLPKKDVSDIKREDNGALDISVRLKYKSFADIMYSVKGYLEKYYKELDISSLNLTKNYLFTKEKTLNIIQNNNNLNVKELVNESIEKSKDSFSKKTNQLITKEEKYNMLMGTKIHEILEYADFKNYKPIGDKFIDSKIKKILDSSIMKDLENAKIYKELEFIYTNNDIEYHGIIDLMIEYDDYINIIDYKLKDITSNDYIKQLKGYKEYIETKSNKKIYLYLYSIIDGVIKEIN